MTSARQERRQLCDLLIEVGPDAPTLCEGWDTHALASHLWVRENDPLGGMGIVVPALAATTERRMAAVRDRWSYPELVERIAKGPSALSPFGWPGVDAVANTAEFWVHHEDVRRAGDPAAEPRPSTPAFEERLWRQLATMGKAMFSSVGHDGLVLEDLDGNRRRIRPGRSTVTLVGAPSELLLYGFGRTGVARVEVIGEPVPVSALPPSYRPPSYGPPSYGRER